MALAALTAKVARRRQPSTAQLTSLIWSFLQVQTQEMPSSDYRKVKCLFHPSIYTISTIHSTLLINSSAPPAHRIAPSRSVRPTANIPRTNLCLPFPGSVSSKAVAGSSNLARRGRKRFLPTSSRTARRRRVFLLRRTPCCQQCCCLNMAMQVYSSPSLRRQQRRVVRVQQRSGRAPTSCLKNGEDRSFLSRADGMTSLRALPKSPPNLCLSLCSKSWSLNTQGLLLCSNIAVPD